MSRLQVSQQANGFKAWLLDNGGSASVAKYGFCPSSGLGVRNWVTSYNDYNFGNVGSCSG